MPSPNPNKLNLSYLLFSICIAAFLTYFVLSLPEGISAALKAPVVSVRGGVGILSYGYGTTTVPPVTTTQNPTEPPTTGGDNPPVDFPGVDPDMCANTSEMVYLAYANGTVKPQNASRAVTFSERDAQKDTLYVKNFNSSHVARDVYVYVSNHTIDPKFGFFPVSVIGKGAKEDPISEMAANAMYNVSVGLVMRQYTGGPFNVSYAIIKCGGYKTYDEFSPVAGAPSPGRTGLSSMILGGKGASKYTPPACTEGNYDFYVTPSSWGITISDTSDPNVICSAIKKKFTIINNGSKKLSGVIVAAVNNLSGLTHFEPSISGVDIKSGENISFIAYVLVNNNTKTNGTNISVIASCRDNQMMTKQVPVTYTNPGTAWTGQWPVAVPAPMRPTWRGSSMEQIMKSPARSRILSGSYTDHFSESAESFICTNCPLARFPFRIPNNITQAMVSNAKLTLSYSGGCGGVANELVLYLNGGGCGPTATSRVLATYTSVGPAGGDPITLDPSWLSYGAGSYTVTPGCGRSWSCGGTTANNVIWAMAGQDTQGHYCVSATYTLSFDVAPGCTEAEPCNFTDTNPYCKLCTSDYTNESLAQSGNISAACGDDIDNDCDALTDCDDIECCTTSNSSGCLGASVFCPVPEDYNSGANCDNGIDDDGDALIDCADIGDCCDEDECASSPFCSQYKYLAGYPTSYTMTQNQSNLVIAGKVLKNKFHELPSGASAAAIKKLKESTRLRNIKGIYQLAIVNETSADGIILYWVHDFENANLNISRLLVERGKSWVAGCGWAGLTTGANATLYVPNWDGDCSDIYECANGLYGCRTGGSLVASGRIDSVSSSDFCIVSNVTCGALENRNGSNLWGGNNSVPTLTGPSVSPTSGDSSTTFNFSVLYTDADNDAPRIVKIRIGKREYDMTAAVAGDTDYTDGKTYFWTKLLKSRSFNVTFFAVDETSFYSASGGATATLGHNPSTGSIDPDFKITVYPKVNLTAGWNYISSPVSLTTNTLTGIGVAASCDTLVYWDPATGSFTDASTIDTTNSFWVWCSAATQATFTGTELSTVNLSFTAPESCTGSKCYQPVAWASLNTAQVADVFLTDCTESGGGAAAQLVMWDPTTQAFQTADSNAQEFDNMIPGNGYYILKPPTVNPSTMCATSAGGGWDYQTWKSYSTEESKCYDPNSRSFVDCWDD